MIEVHSFKVDDYFQVMASSPIDRHSDRFEIKEALATLENEYSRTLKNKVGQVVACFGLIPYSQRCATAWAVLDSRYMRTYLLSVFRLAHAFLNLSNFERIEAFVEKNDFPQGHRWVKLLGFKLEAEELRKFCPNGNSASLYARVT